MNRLRNLSVAAALALASLAGLGAQQATGQTRPFIDSAGRTVQVPARLGRIAPSGVLAQVVLYSLVPDRIIGWSATPPALVKKYLPQRFWELPTFGQFYGKNANLNLESLIAASPDVIIDIGEMKKNVRDDMDALQKQTGIPVVFVEATLETFPRAYRMLGDLTGEAAAAAALSDYCAEAVAGAKAAAAKRQGKPRIRVYYGEGPTGLQTNAAGSIHADLIELLGAENVAKLSIGNGSGSSQITMEQLLLWDPEVVILGPNGAYDKVKTDPLWKDLSAVKRGRVYEIPEGPYNWMGRPPAVNRLIGIPWLAHILYPESYPAVPDAAAMEFYRLFYHYGLSAQEAAGLLARSR
jgi:iron complex transport system substrate-binding protein